MIKKTHTIFIKKKTIIYDFICLLTCLGLILVLTHFFSTKEASQTSSMQQSTKYVILAANSLGMHCYYPDYSGFMLLPPGNDLKVQVFKNEGSEATLVRSGIEVSYQIIDNTTSADKVNFWEYAEDYGYHIPPNIGITGNGMSGSMSLSEDKKYYEVTAIPITPYNDGSTELNPYQIAVITVTDSKTGKELAKIENVVVPVSDEMNCSICHGTNETNLNILKAHDLLSNTNLVAQLAAGRRYQCSECHQDNILSAQQTADVLPLSQAIHGFHANKMSQSKIEPECYSCHPGPVSQCYRGIMSMSGISCVNSKCHGDMTNIAVSQSQGREAWLQEPNCSNCHKEKYGVNNGLLYSNSYLMNSYTEMNGFILCESCHNSPHAEWTSQNPKDNLLPISLQGFAGFIEKCSVCHEGNGMIHQTE
ncbi:MAG TPA: hypothetical protein VJY54_14470 [Lachnospiraceae bacterium]|nr:hypothetical protein [Lachnospiraceae bacterium]